MKKGRFKQLIPLLCFLMVFLLLFSAVNFILQKAGGPENNPTNSWRDFYAEDDDTLDVIVVGSSAMYRYWVAPVAYEQDGYTSFCIGHAGQLFGSVPYIIEEACKTQTPKLFVVETRSLLEESYAISAGQEDEMMNRTLYTISDAYYQMRQSPTREKMLEALLPPGESLWEWKFGFSIVHDRWDTITLDGIKQIWFPEKSRLKSARTVASITPKTPKETLTLQEEWVLQPSDHKKLDQIVQTAEEYGAEVLFVSTPYIVNDEMYSLQVSLRAYCDEMGYDLLDLSSDFSLSGIDAQWDFYNSRHVNLLGARKTTQCVSAYIMQHYQIQTTYSDALREEWDDALEAYLQDEAEKIDTLHEKYGLPEELQ